MLEKELKRENQLKRAQILIDHFGKNKAALEAAHDQYEEYLNDAKGPYESELYSFHVARVQKWIHIIANRLHLYYKLTDEDEPEEFEQLHDGGYDLPFDVPGFETGKFDFYQKVIKNKPRIRKPKEHKQPGRHSQSPDNTGKNPQNSKSNSTQSSRSITPLSSVHSGEPEPENMAKKWTSHYRDIPKFTGAPGEMGATHLIRLNDMSKLFEIQEPQNPDNNAQEIIDLFKTF